MSKSFSDYHRPAVTVDLVIFGFVDDRLCVLLNKRDSDPAKGKWALPGGFVRLDQSLEQAAKFKLKEKTGLKDLYLEQLYTWGDVNRDSRGRVITVSYFAVINTGDKAFQIADSSLAKWEPVNTSLKLPFDHNQILNYALQRLKWKLEYTSVAFSFLSENFSLSEVKKIYDVVFERDFDKRNFMKKIHSLNILKKVGMQEGVANRPAKLYCLKDKIPKIIEIV